MSRTRQIEAIYPLSPMQQGMLFHTIYAPQSGVYFQQLRCTLEGELDQPALRRAWQRVVDRHAILRTAFTWQHHKQPLQVVRQQVTLPWEDHDLRAFDAVEQERQLKSFLTSDREKGFSLTQAPLMRCALMQTGADAYEFVWSYHHILLDGWSIGLVLKEVFACYEAFRRNEDLYLPQPRPYQDYIAWLKQQDMSQAETFWRRRLQGFSAPTPLPAGSSETGECAEFQFEVSADVTAALQQLSRQQQLTMNTIVQGAWALLLSGYSGETDVVFGAVVSGRPALLNGIENMVGLFINTLTVRTDVSDGRTVLEWLQRMQAQQSELRQFEYSPLADVQGWSDVPRRQPLFESVYGFENYPVEFFAAPEGGTLRVRDVRAIEKTSYPLNLMIWQNSTLLLKLFYDTSRFELSLIERLSGHLCTLLEKIAMQPEQRLSELDLLDGDERRLLLVDWNETRVEFPAEQCIHRCFEAQVERTPDAVALICEGEQMTFRELNARANRLARDLRDRGVGPETIVGVSLARGMSLPVALLAILKAGGAYLPLDPSYPRERLAWMAADAGAQLVLTDEYSETQIDTDLENTIGSENLAYVIYTSGSTGRPKGVMATHRATMNRFHWMWQRFPFAPGEVCCQKTNLSFVDSVWEILGPLLQGVTSVIISDEAVHDPALLIETLARHDVSRIVLVPSLLRMILKTETNLRERLGKLRFWVTSGEAVPADLCELFREQLPEAQLINLYGSSEVSADVTYHVIDGEESTVPIGVPISNAQIYILNSRLQPVPVGVSGEVYVGGAGLARGYVKAPELTAAQFIPDNFGDENGARLYRTGDLARFRADGKIEYLGRGDHQVKVRGFRIELGEIEAMLSTHPLVSECVVTARHDAPGETRLVAYLVARAERMPASGELRNFLGEKLPEYMIPAVFSWLPQMPLLPNGKIDRRALPAPEQIAVNDEFVAPRTELEKDLAAIFCEAIGLERASVDKNFFDLGGHSLLAMQVVSRVREKFCVELAVRSLFESPTVAGLAVELEQMLGREHPATPPIQRMARAGNLPCSFAQQRLWFIDQYETDKHLYNLPTAVRLQGDLNVAALAASLNEVVARHETLRTSFVTASGQPVQSIAPHQRFEFPVIDLSGLDHTEREVKRLARHEAQQPFDLSRGPLLRTALLRVSSTEHVLLLTMHHIVSDGWSMGVLVREVAALYEAFVVGKPSPLPSLPVQYADFAAWQRDWLQDGVLEDQLSYWRRQLAGAPSELELPGDTALEPSFRGAHQPWQLSRELLNDVKELGRGEGATLFMTLLAAFLGLAHFYTDKEDLVVGTDVANRNRRETEGLIGFFVNQLVLRVDVSGNPTFRELLRRVSNVCQEAYAHQDLPFDRLVEALNPKRDGSAVLFNVKLILQNAPRPPLALPGLTLTPMETETGTAKYDLLLDLGETERGLQGAAYYKADRFNATFIDRLLKLYETVLQTVTQRADIHLAELNDVLAKSDEEQRLAKEHEFHHARRLKLRTTKRRAVAVPV
jgi:amino acid adenylation domain-containing protein